jgi:hypothetical protein
LRDSPLDDGRTQDGGDVTLTGEITESVRSVVYGEVR